MGGPLVHSGHLNKTSPRPLGTNNASAVSVGAANAPPQASPAVRPMTTGGQMTTSPGVMQRMAVRRAAAAHRFKRPELVTLCR